MAPLQSIIYFAHYYLQIYSLFDCLEIAFFSFMIMRISSWLHKDHTKPLLLYFYSYFVTLSTAYFFQFQTLFHMTLTIAPMYFVILIIHHQKNLQKNFVVSKNKPITPATSMQKEWLETLLRSCLIASHHNKNITCIIEQSDALESLLEKPFALQIPIQQNIIDILLESKSYDASKLLVVNQQGIITSMNALWSDLVVNELVFNQIPESRLVQEYTKVTTLKTDAIIIHINTNLQLNFIGFQGKIIEHITIDQTLKIVQKLLYKKLDEPLLSGVSHDANKSASFSSLYKN